jgi:ribosome recycling factor
MTKSVPTSTSERRKGKYNKTAGKNQDLKITIKYHLRKQQETVTRRKKNEHDSNCSDDLIESDRKRV